MIQQVQRITADGITAVSFPYPSGKYLVKNFSSGNILVSFEDTVAPETSIKIASQMAQVCQINERGGAVGQEKAFTIYVNGTGEVEVQQLFF